MKPWLHKIEVIVDESIPYLIVLLIFIIGGEFFFPEELKPYGAAVSVIDGFIVFVFILDLYFKYIRLNDAKIFFRKYWLEIISLLPVFLVFRLFERLIPLANAGERVQSSIHNALEMEREGKLIVREVERAGQISRVRVLTRLVRPLARIPRLIRALSFYEKPTGKHYHHEKSSNKI